MKMSLATGKSFDFGRGLPCSLSPGLFPAVNQLQPAWTNTPESLFGLQQRLSVVEGQADVLIHGLESLGLQPRELLQLQCLTHQRPHTAVSPTQAAPALAAGGEDQGTQTCPCEALVSRMCQLEDVLQTCRLSLLRLETERELSTTHPACLTEQLSALQHQMAEEQCMARKELVRAEDALRRACQDRAEALEKMQRLEETLEAATSSKVDVVLAAEELKVIKFQMSKKLYELNEQLFQEAAHHLEMKQSHDALLQRVQKLQSVVEAKKKQVKMLQAECHTLQQSRQEEGSRCQELEEQCRQLREMADAKESVVSQLNGELRELQQEVRWRRKDSERLKAALSRQQTLTHQLETQCSELNTALHSLTEENARTARDHQASLEAAQGRMEQQLKEQDLLLDVARGSIQAELTEALTQQLHLQEELQTLGADHAQLRHNYTVAQETAVTERQLLERAIERLQRQLKNVTMKGQSIRRDGTVQAEKQEEESKELMGRLTAAEYQQVWTELSAWKARCHRLELQLRQMVPIHKPLDVVRLDNRTCAQNLANRKLQGRLTDTEEHRNCENHHQCDLTEREAELSKMRTEVTDLTCRLQALKAQLRKERGSGRLA